MNLNEIKEEILKREENLSKYASKSKDAIRFKECEEDIRPAYFHDIDRIIHNLSYTRYMDKTQVYSFLDNDHISKRMTHVQMVSKVARTIGRFLNLNEDLIEAIALGHDIGHIPIGHEGEAILDEISKKHLNQNFMHNVQSVRTYLTLDKNGEGSNLTLQVLDGIMCHNGEILEGIYEPRAKTKEEFMAEYEKTYTDEVTAKKVRPMTIEGCVVRISDVVAYVGRDIEDAISLGVIKREMIPEDIRNILGNTNKEIINTIILDVISNSYDKPYIKLSAPVFEALLKLKKFNYKNIYSVSINDEQREYYRRVFNKLFDTYLDDLEYNRKESSIFRLFLNNMCNTYKEEADKKRIVIDFIAGMTDDLFISEYEKVSC